jgi:tetratricopeptide (TPR) repeat protein
MPRIGVGFVVMAAVAATSGCALDYFEGRQDKFPAGPRMDHLHPEVVATGPGEPITEHEEANLVEPLIEHRTMYARLLNALSEYYDAHGFLNKRRWADTELDDLRHTPAYTYGADVGQLNVRNIPIEGVQEVDLVERLVTHRRTYRRLLDALIRYYAEKRNYEKLDWAEAERKALEFVKPYQYLMSATIPIESLRPQESIAEADRLLEEGKRLAKKGGHGFPALYERRTMKQALNKFHRILVDYPTSDKIAEAAYWLGYIHKEYFYDVAQQIDDNEIAVQYFERAYTWDPNLPLQARFEAAVVYDFRLHDRERALRLYQEVVDRETFEPSNVNFALKRIKQLTGPDRGPEPVERQPVARGSSGAVASPRANEPPAPTPAGRRPEAP